MNNGKFSFTFFASVLVLLFFFSTNMAAQDSGDAAEENTKHSLGAGAGFTTGYGLSYRYRPSKFGVQLNAAPYFDKETSRHSVGLSFLYTLIHTRVSNLYLYQGNHYFYESYMTNIYDPANPYGPGKEERVTTSQVNNGFGFGIELIAAKRVGINLMAGYAFYRNFERLNITGEAGLYYKF